MSRLLLLLLLLFTSCQLTQDLEQDPRTHDQRLRELINDLEDIRMGRGGELGRREREVREEIDRLYYEDPTHVDTAWILGVLAFEDRDLERATWYLDSALRRYPSHARAAETRIRLALEQGSLGFAQRLVERSIMLAPHDAGLREAQALSLYLAEEWREAGRALDEAERLGSPAWRIAFNRGLVAEGLGSKREAGAAYQNAIELRDGDYPRAADRLRGLGL